MILNEFDRNGQQLENYPLKSKDILTYRSIVNFFFGLGWKKIGSGNYSIVLGKKNKNFVVKINTKYDKSFAHYCLLIHKFPNKHFPVISNIKLFKDSHGNKIYVYFIEKLTSLPKNPSVQRLIRDIDDIVNEKRRFTEDIDYYKNVYPHAMAYIDENPEIWNAIDIIAKYGKGIGDIHYENIMMREDGTLVFSDPLAFAEDE